MNFFKSPVILKADHILVILRLGNICDSTNYLKIKTTFKSRLSTI